jgi:hypothetical protein
MAKANPAAEREALVDAFVTSLTDLVQHIAGGSGAAKAAPAEEVEEPATKKRSRNKAEAAKPKVTIEEVRKALIALSEAKDKQAVVEVLSRFGVAKIGDLSEDSYAEAKELAEAEAQAEDDEDGDGEDDPFGE